MARGSAAPRQGRGPAEAQRPALFPSERATCDRTVAAVQAVLGEDAYRAAWAAGRVLPLEEAVALVLEDTAAVVRGR
jgi:hypothetical protein